MRYFLDQLSWLSMATVVCAAGFFLASQSPLQGEETRKQRNLAIDSGLDVNRIFVTHCHECHSASDQQGGLRLDNRESAILGGDSGKVLEPGNSEASKLLRRVSSKGQDRMPPDDGEHAPLSVAEVELIGRWLDAGAPWPDGDNNAGLSSDHWSFQPIVPPEDPSVRNSKWVRNPVDAFTLKKLEENGLTPSPAANRFALLRRASFDLTGLPPTPDEIDRFINDTRPDAYARLIDRLLASPHYGERWGRHWLDVVRYADTSGFEQDYVYANAWRYRDYVIRSFNDHKPFDRFILEQVAGDELFAGDPEAVTATALYSIGPVLKESAMISGQLEYDWLTDAADLTGAAFLGVTLGCARCHSHKYDPISQRDYFGMQAVFAASERVYPDDVRMARIKVLNGLLSDGPLPEELKNDPRCTLKTEASSGLRLAHAESPLEVRRLNRGELAKPAEIVEPALLAVIDSDQEWTRKAREGSPAQRRAVLAQWLVSPGSNPLPARVFVNRVWAWHFGQGIVRTANDFGTQGDPPSHPELLDWLAHDFITNGWNIDRLHRTIMLSSTYQQASSEEPSRGRVEEVMRAAKRDPENRLLWHFPRNRLDGEAVWDHLHACGGELNLEQYGPPVVPPLTESELSGLFQASQKWTVTGEVSQFRRRGVYLFVRRTFLFPMFDVFDPPDVMNSCEGRLETVVPSQSLALLNSPVTATQARAFADRLAAESGGDQDRILQRAWLIAFGRPIRSAEMQRAMSFLETRSEKLTLRNEDLISVDQARHEALVDLCLAMFNSNEFIYID